MKSDQQREAEVERLIDELVEAAQWQMRAEIKLRNARHELAKMLGPATPPEGG